MRTRTLLSSLATLLLSVAVACTGALTSQTGEGEEPALDGAIGPDAEVALGDAAVGVDAAPTSDGEAPVPTPDDGMVPEGRVPVFVAQGHAGRLVRSCDGGRSWIDDQSHDDAIRCFSDGFDCDHHPGAAKGITYGREHFYATFGWGPAGGVFRSEDGVSWAPLMEGTTFGGIAFGAETVLLGARNAQHSTDGGESWSSPTSTSLQGWNVRRVGWVAAGSEGEGRFVVIGDGDGGPDMVLSSDGGETWWRPTFPRGTCGNGVQTGGGVAFGNGVIVVAGGDGNVCHSTDAGRTFTGARVGDGVGSQLVFDGERFFVWARGRAFHSADGANWTAEATSPGDVAPGPVAYHPALGRFVAVRGGWQTWYEQQVFWHSEDGVRWTVAEARGGHPVRFVTAGFAPPSERCPLP